MHDLLVAAWNLLNELENRLNPDQTQILYSDTLWQYYKQSANWISDHAWQQPWEVAKWMGEAMNAYRYAVNYGRHTEE